MKIDICMKTRTFISREKLKNNLTVGSHVVFAWVSQKSNTRLCCGSHPAVFGSSRWICGMFWMWHTQQHGQPLVLVSHSWIESDTCHPISMDTPLAITTFLETIYVLWSLERKISVFLRVISQSEAQLIIIPDIFSFEPAATQLGINVVLCGFALRDVRTAFSFIYLVF